MVKKRKVFQHGSFKLKDKYKVIFTSFSKKNFYLRFQISAFTLLNKCVPINPFMNFDYNLAGSVNKKLIRVSNNTMIMKCGELWVFGEVSDGVLIEIFLAKKYGMSVRFFSISEDIGKFKEIKMNEVILEDVSPWMWEWVVTGKNLERWHPRLRLKKTYPLVYPAYSKRNFFWQMQISQFCVQKRVVPLNPFMLFRYFLGDIIPRERVYVANNSIVSIVDELWTFGEVSDGVLAEVKMVKDRGGKVRYFKIISGDPVKFRRISGKGVQFEDKVLEPYRYILKD